MHSGATLGVVDQMWLNGKPIDLTKNYSVTVNSFLASGGDNFWELANGTHQEDTEQTDLQAQVDYMKQYQSTPLPVDYSQRAVRVTFPANAPATYSAGDTGDVLAQLAADDRSARHPGHVADDQGRRHGACRPRSR